MKTINIATDFSKTPGVRNEAEGSHPGKKFREELLYPLLKEAIDKGTQLKVILDGTSGLGTSFLEESFGGLIRVNKLSYLDLKKSLVLVANEDPDYIEEIEDYLSDANENER